MERNLKLIAVLSLFLMLNSPLLAFQQAEEVKDTTNVSVADSLFNRGNEQDVLGLVSGRFSGMLVSKAGSDPNRPVDALVRGVGTVINSQSPLIVIDGLVGVPQSMIDLNNIESIRLLKGHETTKYGMQGANGVLEITTKGFRKGELQLQFNQSLYLENRIYKDRALERDAFLAAGGNDLGRNSNWMDIITESRVSNISNLTARGSTGKLEYLGAANFRLANGILRETGFEQYNILSKLKWSASESLSISYGGSFTQKNANLGYDYAFKQAYKTNPTQPVYFESGYLYQAVAFEYLNPVGFIDFAERETEQNVITQSLSVQKQFGASSLSLNAAYFNEGSNYYETIDPTFFYYWGRDYFDANASSRSQYSVNAEFAVGSLSLGSLELKEVVRSGFLKRNFDYLSRRISNNALLESADADTISLYNFDVGLTAKLKEVLSTEFYLRYENSSALGENKQSALFPSVSLQFNMGSVFSRLKHFKLNASHGASGLTIYDEDLNVTSNSILYNPDLSHERSLNSDIGFSYQATGQALSFSVTRYKRVSKDILIRNPAFGSSLQYQNLGEIENSGWELEADYDFKIAGKPINSSLTVSTLSTEWTEFPFDELIIGYVELRNEFPVIIQKGLPYGSLYALQANYTDDEITLIDTDGQSPVTYRDRTVVGDALPKLWWAWRNRIALNKTTASFLLEAVHGHDIVNSTNFIRGLNRVYYPSYNILEGGYAFHDESYPLNTAFVERTSFVRLRYIAVDHELTFANRTFHVYAVANNLFTLTNFKGNEPSPRIKDQFETSYMQLPGIQRTTEWLPSRTFMIGVKVQF